MGKRIHDYRLLFRRVFLVSYDVVAILVASALALLLRFEFSYSQIDAKYIEMIWTYFPVNILTTVVVFYFFQLYHSLWAFAGVTEMQNVIASCMLTSFLQMVGMKLMNLNPPRSFCMG